MFQKKIKIISSVKYASNTIFDFFFKEVTQTF